MWIINQSPTGWLATFGWRLLWILQDKREWRSLGTLGSSGCFRVYFMQKYVTNVTNWFMDSSIQTANNFDNKYGNWHLSKCFWFRPRRLQMYFTGCDIHGTVLITKDRLTPRNLLANIRNWSCHHNWSKAREKNDTSGSEFVNIETNVILCKA